MSEYGIYWGDDVVRIDEIERSPLIEGMLWECDTVFVLGQEKVGKSIFSLQMASCLTTGEDFLDTFKIKSTYEVLYLQTEGKRYETQLRLKRMMKGLNCNLDLFTHIFQPGMELDTKLGINTLEKMIEHNERKPKIIFIDPLYMSMSGDMKDARQSRAWIGNVRALCGEYGAALVVVHHTHRQRWTERGMRLEEGDNAIYGSFVWKAFADHVFLLKMRKKEQLYTLTCDTQRSAQVIEKIDFKLHHPEPLLYTIEDAESSSTSIGVHKLLREEGAMTPEQIQERIGKARSTTFRALRCLLKNGMVEKVKDSVPQLYRVK